MNKNHSSVLEYISEHFIHVISCENTLTQVNTFQILTPQKLHFLKGDLVRLVGLHKTLESLQSSDLFKKKTCIVRMTHPFL